LIPAMKYFAADQERYDVYFVTPVGSLVLRETTPAEQKATAEKPHQESQSQKSQSFLLYYVEDHPERYGLVGHTQQEQEEAGVIPGVEQWDLEDDATPVWGIGVNPLLRMKSGESDPDKLWMDFAPPASQLLDLKHAGVTIVPFRACDMFAYWGIFFEFVALPEGVSSFFDRGKLLNTPSGTSATNPIKAACYEYGERWYRWFAEKLVKRASLFVADAFHAWNPAHPLQGISSAAHLPALVLYAGNVKDGLRHLKEYKGSAGGWWRKDEFGIAYRILRSPRLVNHFLPVGAGGSTRVEGKGKQVGLGESACGGVQLPDVGCRQENLGHGGGGVVSRGNEQRALFDWPAADAEQIQAGREQGESAKIASALAKRVTVRDPVSQKIIAAPFAIVADQASSINLRMQDRKDYTDHDHPIIRDIEDRMKPDSGFDAVVYVSFGTQSYIEFTGRGLQYLFGEFSRLKRVFFFIVLPNLRERGATRTKSSPQESSFAFDVEKRPQENVRVVSSYAPQRELFRRFGTGSGNRTTTNDKIADHKRKRFLFISHGGSGSLSEAAAHGVPTLCMPFLNDQWDNCAQLAAANLGKSLAHLSVALIMASYEQSDASVKGAAAAGAETYVSLLGIASPDAFHPAVAGQVRALWEHSLGFADESLGTSVQGVVGDLSLTMDSAEGVLAAAIGEFLFADENYEAVLESLRRNAAAMVSATLDRNTDVGPLLEHFLEKAAEASRRKKEKEAVRDQIMSLGMLASDPDDPDEL